MNAHPQFPQITSKAVGDHVVKTVDGREVHRFLGARKDYTSWMKDRIARFGFVENVDYVVFTNLGENPAGGRPATEYFLTIGMGKELGMVDRSEKGRAIRKYFLAIEEAAVAPPRAMTAAEILLQNAQALVEFERRQVEQERRSAKQAQQIATMDARVDIIEQQAPLKTKPQNAESRSEVRARINRIHGLSAAVVDAVLDHPAYGLRPFAMVKNSHEDAQGSSFGVYWIRDITALFAKFSRESERHSAAMFSHPVINRPFKLTRRE